MKTGFSNDHVKFLYAGSPWQRDDFVARFELSPLNVRYVDSLEDLHGYKDLTLIFAHGFHSVITDDKIVAGYCRTHGIAMISEDTFANQYKEGHYND